MKILIGNNHLHVIGGSETFTYTFGSALQKLGHEVHVYTPTPGIVSTMMTQRLGIPLVKYSDNYDAIFTAHTGACMQVSKFSTFKVQTCHGVIPTLEQPYPGMNAYVSISEEVQNHLSSKGFLSTLIRNGVDLDRFKSTREINERPERILCLSQGGKCATIASKVATLLGAEFRTRNKFNRQNANFDIQEDIDWADLVITLGRGAYESAAMGRNVFVWDSRSYLGNMGDGMLTGATISESLKHNCSGRRFKKVFTDPRSIAAIINTEYSVEHGNFLASFAKRELDSVKQAQKYIELIK